MRDPGGDSKKRVSVAELRQLSVQARQPETLTVEHFLKKLRFAMRTAATRGDYSVMYTVPMIELGHALYDPGKIAARLARAVASEDKKLRVSTAGPIVRVSWGQ